MARPNRWPVVAALLLITMIVVAAPVEAGRDTSPVPVFVDTDSGVDDAFAVAYLLKERQANVVGFSTVFGSTTVANATRNLLTLFAAAGSSRPVAIGAAQPLVYQRVRTGAFVHGPDGFWFNQAPQNLDALPNDAPAAIAAAARANPATTFIALGPLTNFANAVERFPADLQGVRLVVLGGAQNGGNVTPNAEFNVYADPQAFERVLASGLRVELIPLDTFAQVQIDPERFGQRLNNRGGALGELLARMLAPYAQATTQGAGGPITIPDLAAAVYAVRDGIGTPESALVKVVSDGRYTRGETLIATLFSQKILLIATPEELSLLADQAFSTPGFDLNAALFAIQQREPDNAQVVLDIEERELVRLVERALLR